MLRIKRIATGALLTLALTAFPMASALALSPEQECELAGGTFSKTEGTQSCNFTETPGNNQGGVVKTEEETQKGSSRSSHPEDTEDCVVNNGGEHCK